MFDRVKTRLPHPFTYEPETFVYEELGCYFGCPATAAYAVDVLLRADTPGYVFELYRAYEYRLNKPVFQFSSLAFDTPAKLPEEVYV